MPTEFDNNQHYGFFLTGQTLTSETGKYVRMSELVLSALRAAGVLDNMVDSITAPATDKLWLDKNFDPAQLKEWDATGSSWVPMTFDRLFGRAAVGELTVTGGTANAVIVAQPSGFQGNRLYLMTPTATNAAGSTTIQVSGVGTYPAQYGDGSSLLAEEFTAARQTVLMFDGSRFEVLFSIGGLNAAVTASASSASAAASSASSASGSASAAATSAANAASAATSVITGATADDTIDDADEVIYKTGSTIKRGTFAAGLIASIFKTTRTIANARFASATFGLVNAGGKVLFDDTTALTADRTRTWPDKNVNIGNAAKFAILQDQKANGTSGGSSVASAWTTRVLNAEVADADNIVTLASNQFTVAIDCLCRAEAPFYQNSTLRTRIWNVTDNVEAARSPSAVASTANGSAIPAVIAKLTAGKTYRLEYYSNSAQVTNGLGLATSDGGIEVYAQVYLQGLAA